MESVARSPREACAVRGRAFSARISARFFGVRFRLDSRLRGYGGLWGHKDRGAAEGGAPRTFPGRLGDTMLINTPGKLRFISRTPSARAHTRDDVVQMLGRNTDFSLLLGVSVAFWFCKQLTQPRRSRVSEIVYTKAFHLSVCLQCTCEREKPSS